MTEYGVWSLSSVQEALPITVSGIMCHWGRFRWCWTAFYFGENWISSWWDRKKTSQQGLHQMWQQILSLFFLFFWDLDCLTSFHPSCFNVKLLVLVMNLLRNLSPMASHGKLQWFQLNAQQSCHSMIAEDVENTVVSLKCCCSKLVSDYCGSRGRTIW